VIAPWVVFVRPAARILWLLTGWRPPRPFDLISPCRYVVANPFSVEQPPEIRELLERPEYRWEPSADEIPRWLDMSVRLAQIISWAPPIGARHLPSGKRWSTSSRSTG
jgi:hypothetical protein